MIVLLRQNVCKSSVLLLNDDTNENIWTALQVAYIGGKLGKAKVLAANNSKKYIYRLEAGNCNRRE